MVEQIRKCHDLQPPPDLLFTNNPPLRKRGRWLKESLCELSRLGQFMSGLDIYVSSSLLSLALLVPDYRQLPLTSLVGW